MRHTRWLLVLLGALVLGAIWPVGGSTAALQPATPGPASLADPRSDPNGTLRDARALALRADPIAGPLRDEFHLGPAGLELLPAGVHLSDFYARTVYFAPEQQPAGIWSIGIVFWAQDTSDSYAFLIRADDGAATWSFEQQTGATQQTLQQGYLGPGAIDFTAGALNTIGVVVVDGVAILSGNDMAVAATVDLGPLTGSGDVMTQVGFQADDPSTPFSLRFLISDFAVWDLSPDGAGTEASPVPNPPTQTPETSTAISTGGSLKLQAAFDEQRSIAMANEPVAVLPPDMLLQRDSGISFVQAGVELADVYVTATFAAPADVSKRFDMAIGFRDLNDDTEYRFVVASDGGWGLAVGSGAPVERGVVPNFDAGPGTSTTLEVIARGPLGLLAIDGVVVTQVDLSGNLSAGDVYIGSGMFDTYTVAGRQVPYSGVAVYSLAAE